jgi:SAM-dependent methyltransferase
MPPAVKRLKAEYETLQRDLIAKRGFKAQGEMPYKKPAYDGSFLPSRLDDIHALFVELHLRKGQRLVDLGSGDGRVVFLGALFGAEAVGIEGDEELCEVAGQMKGYLLAIPEFELLRNTEIRRADFFNEDLSPFDVAFLYYPQPKDPHEFNRKLMMKLMAELKPGSLYVSLSYGSSCAGIYRRSSD